MLWKVKFQFTKNGDDFFIMEVIFDHLEEFIEDNMRFMEQTRAEDIGENLKKEYKEAVAELLKHNNKVGLRAYAYGHYRGNAIYKQNWKIAEEYLLKLLEDYEDGQAANSLGYIYYYGYTNEGKPNYNKALKFFFIAELANIHEAKYEICDMLIGGKGFPVKMPEMATEKLKELFRDLELDFCAGYFNSKYPDVAIRLGNIFLDEAKKKNKNFALAYKYYLIGRYALELRRKYACQCGDNSIMERLIPKLEEAKAMYKKEQETKNEGLKENIFPDFMKIIIDFVNDIAPYVKIEKLDNGKYRIALLCDLIIALDNEHVEKSLVIIPELDYCKLVKKIELISDYAPELLTYKKNDFMVTRLAIKDGNLNFSSCVDLEIGETEKVLMRLPLEGIDISNIE